MIIDVKYFSPVPNINQNWGYVFHLLIDLHIWSYIITTTTIVYLTKLLMSLGKNITGLYKENYDHVTKCITCSLNSLNYFTGNWYITLPPLLELTWISGSYARPLPAQVERFHRICHNAMVKKLEDNLMIWDIHLNKTFPAIKWIKFSFFCLSRLQSRCSSTNQQYLMYIGDNALKQQHKTFTLTKHIMKEYKRKQVRYADIKKVKNEEFLL